MANYLRKAKTFLSKSKNENPHLAEKLDSLIKEADEIEMLIAGEHEGKVNLTEVMALKRGEIKWKAREYLEDLIANNAVSPNGKWLKMPRATVDGYAAKLYRCGLLERIKVEHHYEYRARNSNFVNKLISKSKIN